MTRLLVALTIAFLFTTPSFAQTDAAPAPVAVVAPGPTLADVISNLQALQASLETTQVRAGRADKRSGQARDVAVVVLVLTVILGGLFLLRGSPVGLSGAGGDAAIARELRRIRKRQAALASAVGQLQEFATQAAEDRELFTNVLASVGSELKSLEEATALVEGPRKS